MPSHKRSNSRRGTIQSLSNRQLIRVCEEFLALIRRDQIAENVTERLRQEGSDVTISRQKVFALVDEAIKRGFFVLRPPPYEKLHREIAEAFGLNSERIEVVDAEGPFIPDYVADRAANVAMRLIREVAAAKALNGQERVVHVGLGAGFTTMKIARHLAHELRAEENLPILVFHALTSGFRVEQPQTAPISFFGLFDNLKTKVQYVGLFARPVVKREDYAAEIENPGAVEAFQRRREIDIVVTSLARAKDEHGDLNIFLQHEKSDIDQLMADGWVGDVMYRPYSMTGVLGREASIKAVALFELAELRDLITQPHKYVLLVSGPCGQCWASRVEALLPLLRVPELAIWSHLVMDRGTAEEIIRRSPQSRTE